MSFGVVSIYTLPVVADLPVFQAALQQPARELLFFCRQQQPACVGKVGLNQSRLQQHSRNWHTLTPRQLFPSAVRLCFLRVYML